MICDVDGERTQINVNNRVPGVPHDFVEISRGKSKGVNMSRDFADRVVRIIQVLGWKEGDIQEMYAPMKEGRREAYNQVVAVPDQTTRIRLITCGKIMDHIPNPQKSYGTSALQLSLTLNDTRITKPSALGRRNKHSEKSSMSSLVKWRSELPGSG